MSIIGSVILPHLPAIIPDVGRGEEREMQKTAEACRDAARRVRAWEPEVLIVVSPHTTSYPDYFHISSGREAAGDLSAFGAPQIQLTVQYDKALRDAIARWARAEMIPAGTLGTKDAALDYGTLVPLYFLREAGVDCPVLRIGLTELPPLEHYRFGQSIAKAVEVVGRRAVFVASGNLSHRLKEDGPYGFAPQGPEFDRQMTAAMADGDFMRFLTAEHTFCIQAKECGLRSFQVMAGALDGLAVEPELLSYEGPCGVGCGVAVFTATGRDETRRFAESCQAAERERLEKRKAAEDPWVRLARLSLETYVRTGRKLTALPEGLPAEMTQRRAGVFVTLTIHGELRGCVGTPYPTEDNVAWQIVENAVGAGFRDRRFPRVGSFELESLEYRVDVLGELEAISSLAELDVKKYGVVVTRGLRQGLMLPNSDKVDNVELQIAIARNHAGISPQEPYTLQRFEVVRHT